MPPSFSDAARTLKEDIGSLDELATRDRLIFASIKLSGDRSLRDVPVRDIYKEAGVRNGSAIRYYFGDKEGLIRAVAQALYHEVVAPVEGRLLELETRAQREPITVRDVVEACFGPSLAMVLKSEFGVAAARANPRFFADENLEIRGLFASAIERRLDSATSLLEPLLPRKCRDEIASDLRWSVTMVLHITQDAFTYNSAGVDLTPKGLAESNERVLKYVTGALCSQGCDA